MRIHSVTAVKDEGPFLLEWLAWHRMLGVTGFTVVSNDCHDGTDRMLDALAAAGVLVHLRNPCVPAESLQWQALKAAWDHPIRKAADWMLISDVDEFPMIHVGNHRLPDLIAALPPGAEAVALAWRLFGANGVARFEDRPVTAQFLHAAPPDMFHPVAASYFKTLFRPAAFRRPGVHRPKQRDAAVPAWVDGSGRPLPAAMAGNDKRLSLMPLKGHRALAEMHHYSLRSAESFVVKSARGLPNHSDKAVDLSYWTGRNFNTQPAPAALALQDPLATEIAALMALPGVADLHRAACDWHRAEAARLIATPAGFRLYADCLYSAGSAALPEAEAVRLLHLYQRTQG